MQQFLSCAAKKCVNDADLVSNVLMVHQTRSWFMAQMTNQATSVQESFRQIAMISSLFAMSPSSMEYGMNLTAAQVTNSAASISSPTFTVNQACLDRCGLAGAPSAG